MCKLGGRDHNATSYSTETSKQYLQARPNTRRRDHNATSYSTETKRPIQFGDFSDVAEIITLRAIALKRIGHDFCEKYMTEQRS